MESRTPVLTIACCVPGRACGGSNLFRPKSGRPFAPDQLRLSRRSVAEGKMMRVVMEWGGYRGQCNRFPGIAIRLRKIPETSVRKLSEALTIAPKLLYGRKMCDLTELLTPLATYNLLYSRKWPRSPRTTSKNPSVSSCRPHCVATSTNLKIFNTIISTVLLVIIDRTVLLLLVLIVIIK